MKTIMLLLAASAAAVILTPGCASEKPRDPSAGQLHCMSNLRTLQSSAFAYAMKKQFHPYSDQGSLAAFQVLLETEPGAELTPEVFVCPSSSNKAAVPGADGKFQLQEENCSYGVNPKRLRSVSVDILFFDREPHHAGKRHTVTTSGLIRLISEEEFQTWWKSVRSTDE